jgi:hypothetical protein
VSGREVRLARSPRYGVRHPVETCRGCSRIGEASAAQRLESCCSNHTRVEKRLTTPTGSPCTRISCGGRSRVSRTRGAPSRLSERTRMAGRSPLPSDPRGLCLPSGAITDPVAAILGSRLPPRRFHDLAVFQGSAVPLCDRSRGAGSSHRLRWPSRALRIRPAGVLRGSGDLLGVRRPYSDIRTEIN